VYDNVKFDPIISQQLKDGTKLHGSDCRVKYQNVGSAVHL